MTEPTVLRIREWSTTTPDTVGSGEILRNVQLSDGDRELIRELESRSSLRFTELRSGLAVSVGQHIGTVGLSSLRIVIMPKMRIRNLMRMVEYAFDLRDMRLTEAQTTYEAAEHGLVDLLGLALLRSVEHVARGGLLSTYQVRHEDLSTPRGRLDMRYIATHPRGATLRCEYDNLTVDHELNRVVAAGLRLGARVMVSRDLRMELARAADRFFGDIERVTLTHDRLMAVAGKMDRRSSHYRTVLRLVSLLYRGARLGDHVGAGLMPLSCFTLDMNMLFERFLGRYLSEHCPTGVRIGVQESRSDVFRYVGDAGGWERPSIRPDFVIYRGGEVVAVADAKYKNRQESPPTTSELYQLTVYGLSYPMPAEREVFLFYPLDSGVGAGQSDSHLPRATVSFVPDGLGRSVLIRVVGVPLDGL
ncbi:MAG: McrC family protein, partial [Polyangiaceae bacterium]|nr:McrC family protein [Polyangiaceae bacterium]